MTSKHFFNKVAFGEKSIKSEKDAISFLEGALQTEPMNVVYWLCDTTKPGATELQKALSLACVPSLQTVVSFFAFLGQDILNRGATKSCAEECYLTAFKTPGLLKVLKDEVLENAVDDASAILWFLVAVSRVCADARDNEDVKIIANHLSETPCLAMSQLATLLIPGKIKAAAFDANNIRSCEQLKSLQSKHDNDFPLDFRKIAIVPTAAELNCENHNGTSLVLGETQSQLEPSVGVDNLPLLTATMLDRQFRLLREDMIAPTKEELSEELRLLQQNPNGCRKLFANPRVVQVELKPKPCVLVRVDTTPALRGRLSKFTTKNDKKSKKDRKGFLEEAGRRCLGRDYMVLFLTGDGTVTHVGVIVLRDPDQIAESVDYLTVGISLVGGSIEEFLSVLPVDNGDHNALPKNKQKLSNANSKVASYLFQVCINHYAAFR